MSKNNHQNLVKYGELKSAKDIAGSRAIRDTIILDNMNLIRALAHKYVKATTHLQVEDLINDGVIGMIRAIDRFDPTRGFEFSTYATFWVRRDIMRALCATSRTICVPERLVGVLTKLRKATAEFVITFGYEPDLLELAKTLGVSLKTAQAAYAVMLEPASLINEDGEPIDVESDAESVENQVAVKLRNQTLRRVIESTLRVKEARVILGRYGLGDDGVERTLRELGEELGLTHERVRQIELEALEVLKSTLSGDLCDI